MTSPTEWLYAVRSGAGGLVAAVVTVAACSAFVLGAGTLGPWPVHDAAPKVHRLTSLQVAHARVTAIARASRAAVGAAPRRGAERVGRPVRAHGVPSRAGTTVPQAGVSGGREVPARPVPTPHPVSRPHAEPTQTAPSAQTVGTVAPVTGAIPALPTLPPPTVPAIALPTVTVPPVTVATVTVPSTTVPSLP